MSLFCISEVKGYMGYKVLDEMCIFSIEIPGHNCVLSMMVARF